MANQSPMMSIPMKRTDDVDWTTPIRHIIAQSYGENPDNYASECAALQRCRQDAVRGAGSDLTARDLLYKYFGQLELLELRFSEIKVTFPWHDAFTSKLITQTSIAYEKASILFQIAATHAKIAASQSRADGEGVKRAFYSFRACAGMLMYINDNFLHAPSTDLSRDVVKLLAGLILAQATEVFFEKLVEEKKGSALVAKVGTQAASMYGQLHEEVKEFMGKGIFDRNWVTIIQIKAKYFSSLSQYHRSLSDSASSKHGDALARMTLADTLAKETLRLLSASYLAPSSYSFSTSAFSSPTLPPDTPTSLQALLKSHATLAAEALATLNRENDLIYHSLPVSPEALPKLEGTPVATPIPIQEVYGAADVQKVIGPDIFTRLVPLSVHESASVYSEEKAKLVRGEVERVDTAEVEVRSALDALGVREQLSRYRSMAEGTAPGGKQEDSVPTEVRKWASDVDGTESGRDSVDKMLDKLGRLREGVRGELESAGRELEIESRECEEMRVRWEHKWTQEPSAGLSKAVRQDLKSHLTAFEAAKTSDSQVLGLWGHLRGDITVLLSQDDLEAVFGDQGEGARGESLLDLVDVGDDEEGERAKIGGFVAEIEERLGRLNKIQRERGEVLKELKEKIQTDDVSHILLLNRRNPSVEPTLFAAELEKFRPFQHRIAATVSSQETVLHELRTLWKGLKDQTARGRGKGAQKKWEEVEKRKKDTTRRFKEAKEGYNEVRDGLGKGLKFYTSLNELASKLRSDIRDFVAGRKVEREGLVSKLETEKRLSAGPPPPLAAKPTPPPKSPGLEQSFAGINLGGRAPPLPGPYSSLPAQQYPPPPPQQQYRSPPPPPTQYNSPAPASQYQPSAPPPSSHYQYQTPPATQYPPPRSQYQATPPPPPPSQYGHQAPTASPPTFLPPPPPRPVQSSFSQGPQSDPYTNLGMFDGQAKPPPPPTTYGQQQQQFQYQQGGYEQQQGQSYGYQGGYGYGQDHR